MHAHDVSSVHADVVNGKTALAVDGGPADGSSDCPLCPPDLSDLPRDMVASAVRRDPVDVVALAVGLGAVDVVALAVGCFPLDVVARLVRRSPVDMVAVAIRGFPLDVVALLVRSFSVDMIALTVRGFPLDVIALLIRLCAVDVVARLVDIRLVCMMCLRSGAACARARSVRATVRVLAPLFDPTLCRRVPPLSPSFMRDNTVDRFFMQSKSFTKFLLSSFSRFVGCAYLIHLSLR